MREQITLPRTRFASRPRLGERQAGTLPRDIGQPGSQTGRGDGRERERVRDGDEQRLYQLVRQKGKVRDRSFTIEFLDPGVDAFAFTFG